jgi:hypothetical protein
MCYLPLGAQADRVAQRGGLTPFLRPTTKEVELMKRIILLATVVTLIAAMMVARLEAIAGYLISDVSPSPEYS